jgi:probable F420-dependent oxidoreductase
MPNGLRFSAQLPTNQIDAGGEFTSARAIGEMARALETAGFDAGYVTEHPFPPSEWLRTGGHHALDPFVSLTAAATTTERLLLHTNILVLPYRNPFMTAKAVASLDVVSGGRAIVGVAAGYLEGEFRALGADFEDRNARMDECIVAMKRAWSGERVELEGSGFEAAGNEMLPTPIQAPHPPIWVGGNSRLAMRRAVEHGQGWCPFPLAAAYSGRARTAAIEDVAKLASRIRELKEHAQSVGRSESIDVVFVPFGAAMTDDAAPDTDALCEQLEQLRGIGVTWVSLAMHARDRAEYCDRAAALGESVIRALR